MFPDVDGEVGGGVLDRSDYVAIQLPRGKVHVS